MSVAALTIRPGLRRRFVLHVGKTKTRRAGAREAAASESVILARAEQRLARLPAGFSDWIWDEPNLRDEATEVLGPRG